MHQSSVSFFFFFFLVIGVRLSDNIDWSRVLRQRSARPRAQSPRRTARHWARVQSLSYRPSDCDGAPWRKERIFAGLDNSRWCRINTPSTLADVYSTPLELFPFRWCRKRGTLKTDAVIIEASSREALLVISFRLAG